MRHHLLATGLALGCALAFSSSIALATGPAALQGLTVAALAGNSPDARAASADDALATPASTRYAKTLAPPTAVPGAKLASLDLAKLEAEDVKRDLAGEPPRFAVPKKVSITPANAGLWEDAKDGTSIWRYRVTAADALSLNFGFAEYALPEGAALWIYDVGRTQVRGPFTAADNEAHGQFWSPVLLADDVIVELSVPSAKRGAVKLALTQIGHGYRGFGEGLARKAGKRLDPFAGLAPEAMVACDVSAVEAETHAEAGDALGLRGNKSAEKSGSCNMDYECLGASDPWRETGRAVAVIGIGGSTFCTGSLVNNTANDRRMLFVTAAHCNVSASQAPSLVAYWNYQNSTCRIPGSAASGNVGNGLLTTFNSGAALIVTNTPSDFTLLELDDPPPPSANVFWAGWDRTPWVAPGGPGNGDHACSAGAPCMAIHHPNTDEKRVTFVERNFETSSYYGTSSPGNGTHIHAWWDPTPVFPPNPAQAIPPQVTEPGSSGSPLYNAQRRFVGQLHGGPSACGATGDDLSDYYGRFAVSYATAPTAFDPIGSGALAIDGVGQCTPTATPTGVVANATAPNRIELTWNPVPNATYRVLRATGACPGTNAVVVADNLAAPSYADTSVSGGTTYSYRVIAVNTTGAACPSNASTCASAAATGVCTVPPTFAGASAADSAGTAQCGVTVKWPAATSGCGGNVTYSVFRSTTPTFTPSAANRVASCVATTSYADSGVTSATPYHYLVRAEDAQSGQAGVCNGGNVDANTIVRSATPTLQSNVLFADDAEAGGARFAAAGTGGGANFAIATTQFRSPTRAWFVPNPTTTSSRTLTFANPITPAAGHVLAFWHREQTEEDYDALVLEYSTDGTTWFDILAGNGGAIPADSTRFIAGGYDGVLDPGSGLGARAAWHGDSNGFRETRVDLSDFAGTNLRLRFRFSSDSAVGGTGVWIDDVRVSVESACGVAFPDALFRDGFE